MSSKFGKGESIVLVTFAKKRGTLAMASSGVFTFAFLLLVLNIS